MLAASVAVDVSKRAGDLARTRKARAEEEALLLML
jgi:hypothetical protein